MISIFTMAYNEDVFLQFMIDHYKTKFPQCSITLFDNQSTDRTKEIALKNGCNVIDFNTNNQIDDYKITNLKNNCWKKSNTDWVLVCDPDELLNIDEEQLKTEAAKGTTIIRSEGWNMVNMADNFDFANIKHGTRVSQYDKAYLFNKNQIKEINYSCGAHRHSAMGNIRYSENIYPLYHYKCINPDYLVQRFKWTATRLSDINKRAGMGTYWLESSEENIKAGFYNGREAAKNNKIIP